MQRLVALSIGLLVVIMLIVTSSAQMMSAVNINSHGTITSLLPLHTSGVWIEDSSSNRIQLRGAATAYNDYERDYIASNGTLVGPITTYIQWLKSTGCDCVRLAFNMPDPYGNWSLTNSGLWYNTTLMKSIVNTYNQNGIYVILDDHDSHGSGGNTGILPTYNQTWISDWVSIAQTFKSATGVAVYQLMNEPWGPANMTALYLACISALRATGDNHIVLCDTSAFSNASQISGITNFVIGTHGFEPAGGHLLSDSNEAFFPNDTLISTPTYNTTGYIESEIYASTRVSEILDLRQIMGCPVMDDEMEVYNYTMASPNAYENALEIDMFEQYGIPWNAWWMWGWYTGQYGANGTTYWASFVKYWLGGPFTSNYVKSSVPFNQTITYQSFNQVYGSGTGYGGDYGAYTRLIYPSFPALPFNIWNNVNLTSSKMWCVEYTVNFIIIPSQSPSVDTVVFHGPCMLLVQCWGSGAWHYGTVANYQIVTLSSGQTISATCGNYTNVVVYAWANSITSLPLTNG